MPDIDCLVFSPHPDDAELFCGGLLLKLKKQGFGSVYNLKGGLLAWQKEALPLTKNN